MNDAANLVTAIGVLIVGVGAGALLLYLGRAIDRISKRQD